MWRKVDHPSASSAKVKKVTGAAPSLPIFRCSTHNDVVVVVVVPATAYMV